MIYDGATVYGGAVNNCKNLDTVYVYKNYSTLQTNLNANWNNNTNDITFIDYGTTYNGKVVWKKDAYGNVELLTA